MESDWPVQFDGHGRLAIAPTDVAQFVRLEQCERYLRLRLHERTVDRGFMRKYGATPQALPPLLTREGASFEQKVTEAIVAYAPTLDMAPKGEASGQRPADNERMIEQARAIEPGGTLVVFQPRLEVPIAGWVVRGDIDILRFKRSNEGQLRILIADIKSSASAKIEHRVQVAFYHAMLSALLIGAGVEVASIDLSILYRGPAEGAKAPSDVEAGAIEAQRAAAASLFGVEFALLDVVDDPEPYLQTVRDLVTSPTSVARQAATHPFAEVPFHLGHKCDGCVYNEFCMKWCAEHDDLSLLPHLATNEKSALLRAGVTTMWRLAQLKSPQRDTTIEPGATIDEVETSSASNDDMVRRLAATWPVGPRLDELIFRARRSTRRRHDIPHDSIDIPSKGYGSLPNCDEQQNPNLVRVYVDAQYDYVEQRIYMLSALVAASQDGNDDARRRRAIVHMTDGPPRNPQQEEALFVHWLQETIGAVVELAAPDDQGRARAPIHLIFYDHLEQRLLLDGLARHFATVFGATPLYDFVTQLAAYDSPVVTFLDQEIRELRHFPMVCQSLQAVAAHLKFDWNEGQPYRKDLFTHRLFDFWRKLDEAPVVEHKEQHGDQRSLWYMGRSRFSSMIPLEYAYAAWRELPERPGDREGRQNQAPYRNATVPLLRGFQARRLDALEHIARSFSGNRHTTKTTFELPDLAAFEHRAATLAHALDEFVTIERHVELGTWKSARLPSPERRVLSGVTLLAEYHEADQETGVAELNRDHARRQGRYQAFASDYLAANPEATRTELTKEQRREAGWSHEGVRFRLRLTCAGLDCDLEEALGLTTLRPGDRVVVATRTTVDSRLPEAERTEFTPTPKQLLYAMRGDIAGIQVERDSGGKAVAGFVDLRMISGHAKAPRGFAFPTMRDVPLQESVTYTLDEDPNNWYGAWCGEVTSGLREIEEGLRDSHHTLYERLTTRETPEIVWSPAAVEGQRRFLDGLDALHHHGILNEFEQSKRDFIGGFGDAPTLLVQGPPGTGKSYSTAFALFARLQGAGAADVPFRVFLSCKTHAATDVLLENCVRVQEKLRDVALHHPALFALWFDRRLLDLHLYRVNPREGSLQNVPSVAPLSSKKMKGQPRATQILDQQRWCVVAATPGGIRQVVKEQWPKDLFGHDLCDCLVLDEASQMNLPEACMAALVLKRDGRLIVVGDPRQMPPIVKHDWGGEPRRTFQAFKSYESLFATLMRIEKPAPLPMIKFQESFRLHRDMAEFLRQEIYRHDGIAYFSRLHDVLATVHEADDFVAAALSPEHSIVVILHDEAGSQVRNLFERDLLAPILEALSGKAGHNLDPERGIGVVVPHRAQRAALKEAVPGLMRIDPVTGVDTASAIDTVERFQGQERTVIAVSATESDRDYLLVSSQFLLDPRRLTVALSRAKRKMILVAARTVFDIFSPDEETFAHAQMWKNLLHRACTVPLWSGERSGVHVEVWGNDATRHAASPGTSPGIRQVQG